MRAAVGCLMLVAVACSNPISATDSVAVGMWGGDHATVSQESSKKLPELVRWIFGQGLNARLSVVRQPESKEAYSLFRLTGTRSAVEDEYRELIAAVNAAFEEAFLELEKESYVIDLRSALSICKLHSDSPSLSSCCGIGSNHVVINENGELASCPGPTRCHPFTRSTST